MRFRCQMSPFNLPCLQHIQSLFQVQSLYELINHISPFFLPSSSPVGSLMSVSVWLFSVNVTLTHGSKQRKIKEILFLYFSELLVSTSKREKPPTTTGGEGGWRSLHVITHLEIKCISIFLVIFFL